MNIKSTFRKGFAAAALAAALFAGAKSAQAQADVEVNVAPPAIPDYDQPEIPGDGYIWTPGYWAWGPNG